ncbi:hypothetical protein [Pseudomonas aeruginosa]|uniref:hypothetical protein n=1 Tax=Pseudomonas aeruginosa TaxID=287 RepID=UPI00374811F5
MTEIYSSGSYGLFTPGEISKRVGTLKNGHMKIVDSSNEFRVYANHLFISEDHQNFGRCVGEIDSAGIVSDMGGRPIFKLVREC